MPGSANHFAESGIDPPANGCPAPGAPTVYWLLVSLGLGGFAPCVLLPVWRDYQVAVMLEQWEAEKTSALQGEVDELRRYVTALRTDPAVAARLAERELSYRRPGEAHMIVANLDEPEPAEQDNRLGIHRGVPVHLQPPSVPSPLARWASWLPDLDYDAVFCRPPTRTLVMLISGGAIAAAMILFCSRRSLSARVSGGPAQLSSSN